MCTVAGLHRGRYPASLRNLRTSNIYAQAHTDQQAMRMHMHMRMASPGALKCMAAARSHRTALAIKYANTSTNSGAATNAIHVDICE